MLKLVRSYPAATLIGLVLLFFVFSVNLARFYTDWLWYGEVGYRNVFGTMYGTRLLLFLVFGALSFTLAYVNLRLAERFSPPVGIDLPGDGPGGRDVFILDRDGRPRRAAVDGRIVSALSGVRRILAAALLVGALFFALVSGLSASGEWESFLRLRNGTAWGTRDALFGRDIGFYVFTLPFLRYVQGWLLVVLLLVAAAVALLYFFQRGIDTAAGRTFVAPHVRAHLSALAALALLVQAWGYWMDRFDLLLGQGPLFTGAGYADVHARLPALNLLVVVAVLAAVAVLVNIRRRSMALLGGALALWLIAWFGAGVLYPGFVQATVVRPNEATREAPFIQRAIAATRAAYGLEKVEVRDFAAAQDLSGADLGRNRATLNNLRLWDYEPLLETYPQQQGLRQYYAFPDVDVDRYRLGGEAGYRQVWLAAREIAPEQLDERARTWPNLRLRYTHGFGMVMSPVNAFTGEGSPTYFLQNIPTESSVPGLTLREPRIYYGQGQKRGTYVVVGTRQREFDYPSDAAPAGASGPAVSAAESAAADKENAYGGKGGVPLRGLAKIAFAWRFHEPTLLLSRDVTGDSRLMFARRVDDRISRVAPFLRLDNDPYPVITRAGRVVWVQDAYTLTNAYPYAAPVQARSLTGAPQRFNYLRNAVKATVDAYDGTVTLYAADEQDPILRTYRRIFPRLIKPLSEMPADLRPHMRYPEDLFAVQRRILADYHVTDPGVFYARTDSWAIARERRDVERDGAGLAATASGEAAEMDPYYAMLRLPGERETEFLLLSPFTPRSRQNMIAWLAARCDGDRLGQLVLYRFPPRRTVNGPQQIGTLIRQDSRISPQLSLWNQQGSQVLLGNLLVVPIEKSLLYVQPLYLKAESQGAAEVGQGSSAIPQLKRVIVAFENRVAMEETLEAALARLFPGGGAAAAPAAGAPGPAAPAPDAVGGETVEALVAEANAQYERGQAALRAGDFAAYGRETRALGETLRRLRARSGAAGEGSSPAPAAGAAR